MTQATVANLFDHNTTLVNSATLVNGVLTVNFANNAISPIQAFGAIVQSGHQWLLQNTDASVNASASPASTFSSTRNGSDKQQYTLSISIYGPLTSTTFDPLSL